MIMKVINIIEAFIGFYVTIWIYLYYTGRIHYKNDKEERRRRKVEKYGWILILCGFMSLIGSLAIIIGTLWDF